MGTFEVSTEERRELLLPCAGNCAGRTYHRVLARAQCRDSEQTVDFYEQHDIVQCQGCKIVSFRSDWQCSEEVEPDDDGALVLASHEKLFPSRSIGSQLPTGELPPKVANIYKETKEAITSKLGVLAGIGIRTLVEAVCADKNAGANNLEKRIDELVTMKVLTEEGAEILHGTRLLGNIAAHEVEPPSEEALTAAIVVAENLLQSVYVIPAYARHLPKRKKTIQTA